MRNGAGTRPPSSSVCRARTRILALSWYFCSCYAARWYSLIRPWTTCLHARNPLTTRACHSCQPGGTEPLGPTGDSHQGDAIGHYAM